MEEKDKDPIALGSFDEMVNLASTRAFNEGGVVVVHKEFCDEPQDTNCPCQPLIMEPYTPVAEDDMRGAVN